MDFITGVWRAETGLVDRDTGQPLRQRYEFRDDGSGSVRLDRADGVACVGAARARRNPDGSVEIAEQGEIECPDGRAFQPSVTHCVNGPGGRAICRGKNLGGGPDYKVEITR
ncbi:MAG: hypothetical protein GKR94_21460 [Gammaproteobacteria bacterium]|nr:hypothetical protein [Gammaproteobacteria bacterium]